MLKRRVIPLFLLLERRLVKGCQFGDHRDTGDPRTTMRVYAAQDADEIMLIDIATPHRLTRDPAMLEEIADECDVPLSIGGGVVSPEQVGKLLASGADKVVMTSAGLHDPDALRRVVDAFGSQCVIGAIEYRNFPTGPRVTSRRGSQDTGVSVLDHVETLASLGAGEILLNCVDKDGTRSGFDVETVLRAVNVTSSPVIAAGGAGNLEDLAALFEQTGADAAACGTIFHLGDNNPIRARSFLRNRGIPMRNLK